MNKKHLLIILIVAVLVTGLSWFWESKMHIIGGGEIHRGLPLQFWKTNILRPVVVSPDGSWVERDYQTKAMWNPLNLGINLLFWFLVLAMLWIVVKWIKGKVWKK